MATDQRTKRPSGSTPAEGGDVGGIPGTMKRGVADATDRKAARRDGPRDDDRDAGSAMTGSTASGAYAPKDGIDRTGAPGAQRNTGSGPGRDPASTRRADEPRGDGNRSADGDDSGQDDTGPESLGKSISEPFRSS